MEANVSQAHTKLVKTELGFWLYLMTDCMLFASLFAVFVVLRDATSGGPTGRDIFEMPLVLLETVLLLTSSFFCGMALVGVQQKKRSTIAGGLALTGLLGLGFLAIELSEFVKLFSEGHSWQVSAFLSAFFVLVGTHGLHIFFGLLWLSILLIRLYKHKQDEKFSRQLTLFALFWHFLDLVWIFVFTIVYLMGVSA